MQLAGTDAYGNAVTRTVTTIAGGTYLFDNLPPSNGAGYTITEVAQPTGFTDGKETAGSVGGTPGANYTTDIISGAILPANTAATGYLFGELPPVTVSGTVFNDTNGLNDTFVNGTGTNAGSGTLTAYLVRGGLVVSSNTVAVNGTFSLAAAANTTGYTVVLSNTAGVAVGTAPPATSLPAGWVNTGENNDLPTNAGSDGTINGVSASFDVLLATVPNRNFGIERPPTAGTATYPVQTNPGGTGTLPVGAGAFTGALPGGVVGSNATDPTAVTNIRITAFPSNVTSITINGTTYTAGTFPPGGVTVTIAELAGMNVDPIDGLNTIDIPYVAIDAAGQESNLGHVILPFTGVTVSGNVYDDANGLLGAPANTVDGTGTNASSGTLTAYLVNSAGNIAGVSPVLASGVFSFGGVTSATGYTVVLSNSATGVLGAPPPAPSLPADWVNTGENNAASSVVGSDGTVNGISAQFDVIGVDVIDRNFGIDHRPTTTDVTGVVQPNPGGAIQVQVPTLVGGDTEDGPKGAGNTFIISTLPNPATMGLLYYNGVLVTAGQTIVNYDPTLLTIDPVDGALSAVFTVASVDAAGVADLTPNTVTIPFSQLIISGNVFNDLDGSKVKNGAENSVIPAGLNAVLTDAAGVVIAVVSVDASGNYSLPASPNTTYSVVITLANPAIGATSVPVSLPAGWVTTGENLAGVVENNPDSRQTVTTGVVDRINVNFGIAQPTAAVSGNVWRDLDHNRALGAGETAVQGITVELLNSAGTAVVKTAVTDASGHYVMTGLAPGDYTVRFRDNATGGIILGSPTYDDQVANTLPGAGTGATPIGSSNIDTIGQTLKVSLIANQELVKQSLPFDPSGVVYNSITREPVPGATVTLYSGGVAVPNNCLIGNLNTQVTGPLGTYQYLLIRPVPVGCPGTGAYRIQVDEPSGYLPPNAQQGGVTAPAGTYTPTAGVGVDAIQAQSTPPTGAQSTLYYFDFNFDLVGGRGVVNNHIPLDPVLSNSFIVTKTGNKSIAEIGDVVTYTVKARMTQGLRLATFDLVDNLPAGFRYIPGTATQSTGGVAQTPLADPLPAGNLGPQLTFKPTFAAQVTDATVTYKVRVGVGAMQGDGINRVQGRSPFATSNTAQFKVKVTGGVFTNDACLAGKVFVDCNNNHIQDAEELGIPGVRMYMEDGTYFISDVEGKFSYCGISPKTHVLKVDSLTMPRGSRLTTTSNRNAGDANSLFLDTKNGELIRADFAEGTCSNTVLEQVKARRTQGEVRAPETEKKGGPAIKFEGKSPAYPQQGTDSANQRLVKPRGGAGEAPVSNTVNDNPVQPLSESSGNTRGNNLRDQEGGAK
ncbi:MAG TPA: SdrD B-like domain-containing protein [Methylotenera sp.]|nr:SdrD B-like domain-containing protein [Methylotenera sp.]